MELREYLRVLRRQWILIAVITILGIGVAVLLTAITPKSYKATARVFVNVPVSSGSTNNSQLADASQFAQARVKSYVGLANSDSLLKPVIDKLDLKATNVTDLAKQVSISNPADTILLDVSATDHNPDQAAKIANAVATQLVTTIEDLEQSRSGGQSQVTVTVIRNATPPTTPISPKPLLNYALGLVIGLAAGIAVAVTRERMDTRIKSSGQVSELTRGVPLGAVAYSSELANNPLVALSPRTALAEAYRSIRTRLQFVDVDNPPSRFVITSSVPSEGKSVSACNLAITIATTGLRVCLVEGDMRRPRLAQYLGVDGSVGLSNVLARQHELDDVLVPWHDGLLSLLPAGTTPPDPSDLLGSQHMRDLIGELGDRFDVVIIDAPPLLPVTDAAVLAHEVDGAVVVVRQGRTRQTELRRSVEALRQANARLLGTVITFAPANLDGYGNASAYGYGDSVADTPSHAASHSESTERVGRRSRVRS